MGGGVKEGKVGVCQVRVPLKDRGSRYLRIRPAVGGSDSERERG